MQTQTGEPLLRRAVPRGEDLYGPDSPEVAEPLHRLALILVHTGRPEQPLIRWSNPFAPQLQGDGRQWHDDEIGVAGCIDSLVRAVREDAEPSYGAQQGRLDQELICALRKSSAAAGAPVRLPLDPDEVIPA